MTNPFFERGVKPADGAGPPSLFSDNLDDVAKALAGAFAVLSGLLGFFGVKDGTLDRLLRTNAAVALWIFLLLLAGVACGIVAPAFSSYAGIRLWLPTSIGLVAGGVNWALVRNLSGLNHSEKTLTNGLTIVLVVSAMAVLAYGAEQYVRAPVAVLIIGFTLVGLGLYSAAKLSVLSKGFTGAPSVEVSLSSDAVGLSVAVDVKATDRDRPLLVQLLGESAAGGTTKSTEVAATTLAVDAGGSISATPKLLIDPDRYAKYQVLVCDGTFSKPGEMGDIAVADCRRTKNDQIPDTTSTAFTFQGTPGSAVVTGSVALDPATHILTYSVQVRDAAPSDLVRVTLVRTIAGHMLTISSGIVSLTSIGGGTITGSVTSVASGNSYVLEYVDPAVSTKPMTLSSYSAP